MLRRAARPKSRGAPPQVVVVGAGAFGGWTALHLLRLGARVTLVDAWGAGHLRGTSSGETRILRCGYGAKSVYTDWAWRALAQWKRFEKEQPTPVFVPSGVLWLCPVEDEYTCASLAALKEKKIPVERLSVSDLQRRFPQFSTQGMAFGYFEPRAGFLRARVATQAVASAVAREGGRVLTAAVAAPFRAPSERGAALKKLRLSDGSSLEAGHFVFACGPWLPELFPALLARRIRVTRQEVLFFGPPAGEMLYDAPRMPAWIETGVSFYGIPAADARGLKVADDNSGPFFDPTRGERTVVPESIAAARRYLAQRIPAMAAAPLVETRVCQYERTPDAHLVIDRHPQHENVWLVGGGSGHGFKLGPAVGEFVARQVLQKRAEPILPAMRLGASAWPAEMARPATRSI